MSQLPGGSLRVAPRRPRARARARARGRGRGRGRAPAPARAPTTAPWTSPGPCPQVPELAGFGPPRRFTRNWQVRSQLACPEYDSRVQVQLTVSTRQFTPCGVLKSEGSRLSQAVHFPQPAWGLSACSPHLRGHAPLPLCPSAPLPLSPSAPLRLAGSPRPATRSPRPAPRKAGLKAQILLASLRRTCAPRPFCAMRKGLPQLASPFCLLPKPSCSSHRHWRPEKEEAKSAANMQDKTARRMSCDHDSSGFGVTATRQWEAVGRSGRQWKAMRCSAVRLPCHGSASAPPALPAPPCTSCTACTFCTAGPCLTMDKQLAGRPVTDRCRGAGPLGRGGQGVGMEEGAKEKMGGKMDMSKGGDAVQANRTAKDPDSGSGWPLSRRCGATVVTAGADSGRSCRDDSGRRCRDEIGRPRRDDSGRRVRDDSGATASTPPDQGGRRRPLSAVVGDCGRLSWAF
jgi:hypothetical protein